MRYLIIYKSNEVISAIIAYGTNISIKNYNGEPQYSFESYNDAEKWVNHLSSNDSYHKLTEEEKSRIEIVSEEDFKLMLMMQEIIV